MEFFHHATLVPAIDRPCFVILGLDPRIHAATLQFAHSTTLETKRCYS